jgi:uncharacterized BrkB/YihY/UPF0761 family membrane protein
MGKRNMNTLVALLFVLMGALFLLISTVFYPVITSSLIKIGEHTGGYPSFWNLVVVLKIVRVIFCVVGGFLAVFGILLPTKKLPLEF